MTEVDMHAPLSEKLRLRVSEVRSCDGAADSSDAATDASGAGFAVPVGKGSPVAVDQEPHAGSDERDGQGGFCLW